MFRLNCYFCGLFLLICGRIAACGSVTKPILFPDSNANFKIPGIEVISTTPDPENFDAYEKEVHSMESIEDFIKYFNVNISKDLPPDNFSLSLRVGVLRADSDSAQNEPRDLPQATCEPEITTVPLDLPQENGKTYFPTCVRVNRCGGCCFLSHHSCQPVSKETIYVKAIQAQEEVLTRNRRRTTRDAESRVISVPVEKHNSCECRCRLQETDCDPQIHSYNKHQCACVCKNKSDQLQCYESKEHFWVDSECKCLCRHKRPCSTGQSFDHKTCKCV